MPLPKIDVPNYEIKIPSTGKEITIRPFLVGEEKLLLMAIETNDPKEISTTTKQVVKNCIISGDVNVDNLPFFDIDYIFIVLRAKSVSDTIDVNYTCNNVVNGDLCGETFAAKIDVTNCEIYKNEAIKFDIKLSGSMLIKMKYPSYSLMKTLYDNENDLEKKIKIICGCVEKVIDKDKVYTTKDFTPLELKNFIENLTQEQFKKLQEFIDNFPTFVITGEATCGRCGTNHKLRYDDFDSFFF
jgi:hypothetical protein